MATLKFLTLRELLLASVALFAAGCSFTLDFEGDCAADDDCAAVGERMLCQSGTCVQDQSPQVCEVLLEAGCDDIYGPLEDDPGSTVEERVAAYQANPDGFVLVSVHTPRSGFASTGREIIEAAVRVAVEDINRGRAFLDIDGTGRKLAAVVCNDGSGGAEATGVEAARHAVECGAKAIIATQDTEPTLAIYTEVARTLNVPIVSPGAISPAIPDIRTTVGQTENDDLLWRVRVPGGTTGRAVAAALKARRTELVSAGAGGQLDRVVVFHRSGEQYGDKMYEVFDGELCRGSFCEDVTVISYAYEKLFGELKGEIADFLADQGDVDLVVTLTSELFDLLDVLTGTAAAFPDEASAPDVLMVEGARSSIAVPTFVAGDATRLPLACRAVGVSGASEGNSFANWLSILKTQGEQYVTLTEGQTFESRLVAPTAAYNDAVFMTAYAMAAAALRSADGQIDTPGIIGGLKRLSDTRANTVPPFNWAAGLDLLRQNQGGGTMNYEGASGPIDLDAQSNDVRNALTDLWQYGLNADMATGLRQDTVVVETLGLLTEGGSSDAFEINTQLFDALDRTANGTVCDGIDYRALVLPAEMPAE